MSRSPLACLALCLVACAGTETGNPEYTGSLSYNAHSSDAATVALSGDAANLAVADVWLVLGDVRFVPDDACDAGATGEVHSTGLGPGNHGTPAAARVPYALAAGSYCGADIPFEPLAGELPEGAPASLQGRSIVITGELDDGTPFEVASAFDDPVALRDPGGGFPLSGDEPDVLVTFDLAAWLGDLDLAGVSPDADGTLRVDQERDPTRLSDFEARLAGGTALRRDTLEGQVDGAQPPLATGR